MEVQALEKAQGKAGVRMGATKTAHSVEDIQRLNGEGNAFLHSHALRRGRSSAKEGTTIGGSRGTTQAYSAARRRN
jgi:hypothetical protein